MRKQVANPTIRIGEWMPQQPIYGLQVEIGWISSQPITQRPNLKPMASHNMFCLMPRWHQGPFGPRQPRGYIHEKVTRWKVATQRLKFTISNIIYIYNMIDTYSTLYINIYYIMCTQIYVSTCNTHIDLCFISHTHKYIYIY